MLALQSKEARAGKAGDKTRRGMKGGFSIVLCTIEQPRMAESVPL
ncbi:MAG: hypothetical protein OJF48_001037 [Afipia sp.]|jgi:hypothetical protein|nr:MAG: hypothetical protein OJF48_001037 [Afipia sp.]